MYFIEVCDLEHQPNNPQIDSILCPIHTLTQANSEADLSISSEVMARTGHFYVFY